MNYLKLWNLWLFNGKVVLLHTITIQITLSNYSNRKELKTSMHIR